MPYSILAREREDSSKRLVFSSSFLILKKFFRYPSSDRLSPFFIHRRPSLVAFSTYSLVFWMCRRRCSELLRALILTFSSSSPDVRYVSPRESLTVGHWNLERETPQGIDNQHIACAFCAASSKDFLKAKSVLDNVDRKDSTSKILKV